MRLIKQKVTQSLKYLFKNIKVQFRIVFENCVFSQLEYAFTILVKRFVRLLNFCSNDPIDQVSYKF